MLNNAVIAAQPALRFERLSIADGLPQATVAAIITDSKGFLWVGTDDGLARYDGYNFKIFKYSADNEDSISSNSITAITEDSHGNIWLGTMDGLNRFDPKSETFKRYQVDLNNAASLSDNYVNAIFEDSLGRLWVGTRDGGLNRFDAKLDVFTHLTFEANNPNSLSNNKVYAIYEDSQGALWVGTKGGLNRFDPKSEAFKRYYFDANDPQSLSDNWISSIIEDHLGNLWIGTWGGGLNRLNLETNAFTHYRHNDALPTSLSDDKINTLEIDSQGSLWIGTELSGLDRFNPKTDLFTHYRYQVNNPNSLSDDTVYVISKGTQGNVWVGTHDGGLNRFNLRTQVFNHYRSDPDKPDSLSADDIYAISEDLNGNLWVGTDSGGLNRFDPKTKLFSHYQSNTNDTNDTNSLSDNSVSALTTDKQGNLWIGTNSGGVNYIDLKTNIITQYINKSSENNVLSDNRVSTITTDKQGNLWVGTWGGGLNHFNPKTKKFTLYRHKAGSNNSLLDDAVTVITEDSLGNLWLGTKLGLSQFNPNTKQFIHYRYDVTTARKIRGSDILAIKEDSQGDIWIGTDVGLNHFNRTTQEFTLYSEKHGLPNNVIYSIEEDNHGYLWLSINKGLSRFNYHNKTFKNYDAADGLQHNEFNKGASFKSNSGELFFGGINGFNRFFPEQIEHDQDSPAVVITDILLLNKSVPIAKAGIPQSADKNEFTLAQAIHLTKAITLNYHHNVVAFEFSALHFVNPQKNQFAYKLEGFDQDWVTTDYKNRRASYTNLPAGDYILRVKASNADGFWNEQGVSLSISVLPAPWKTWWAYTLYGLIFLGLFGFYARLQHNKIVFERHINAQLENKVKQRTVDLQKANNKLQKANENLAELSFTDQLTGLKNRRFLFNHLKDDIALIQRKYKEFSLSNTQKIIAESDLIFFIVDLDHFKQVNDIYGHSAGDAVISQVKKILELVFRETDYLIRWGGEEFLVIARFTERSKAPELAERLRLAIKNHDFKIGAGEILHKTCSIGFACYPFSTQETQLLTWEQVIDVADHCMFAAKNSSRNAWVGINSKNDNLDHELFTRFFEQTQTLIQSGELEIITSISEHWHIKW